MLGRIIGFLLLLIILGFIGLTGYAYLADLGPAQSEVIRPVELDGN